LTLLPLGTPHSNTATGARKKVVVVVDARTHSRVAGALPAGCFCCPALLGDEQKNVTSIMGIFFKKVSEVK
jgi:hypothetical protein